MEVVDVASGALSPAEVVPVRRAVGSRWFALLVKRSKALAKASGVAYPAATPEGNRDMHAKAERELGERLTKLFREGR